MKLLVVLAVGLRPCDLADAPKIQSLAGEGFAVPLHSVFPAVTCTVQASFLTGRLPREHGIVGNGWYHRDTSEIRFWLQSNRLIEGTTFVESAVTGTPSRRVAKLFWWFNMYSAAQLAVTPRPEYHSDGMKVPGLYSEPADLKDRLQEELGSFPLFKFWGPGAGIESTEWIASSASRVLAKEDPDLALVYLPHLDYDHQRFGPDDPRSRQAVAELDRVVGGLIDGARSEGREVLILSEYGIEPVQQPVFLNRALRESGLLRVQKTGHGELLDAGASDAFAVCDHQAAHVYVRDSARIRAVAQQLQSLEGVARVLDRGGQHELGIDHPRAGELVCVAEPGCWFAYPYWLEESARPDFATSVDIHRKPGYDPAELFVDPKIRSPKARIIRRVLQKKLGFRYRMDVISTDPSQVRGSHGLLPTDPERGAVAVGSFPFNRDLLAAVEVSDLIQARLRASSFRD